MDISNRQDVCAALAAASRDWTGGTPSGAMMATTRAFLARVKDDSELLASVAASLGNHEPGAAAWIAVACGTAVERGAAADVAGPAVFELLRSWLPRLPHLHGESEDGSEVTPAQTALLTLFSFLCQSAVTHLARLPAQRRALGEDVPLLDRLGELQGFSHGAAWVREALLKASGTLVFLHPESVSGLRIQYTNVSNCFHLFSLMQTVIGTRIPGGRVPDEMISRVARGKSTESVDDEAWWHYGTARSRKADLSTSIWGEGLVRDIPAVDGTQVVIAWPPLLKTREWDSGFLGPHLEALPASVEIDSELTVPETEGWLIALGLKARKRWWRFASAG